MRKFLFMSAVGTVGGGAFFISSEKSSPYLRMANLVGTASVICSDYARLKYIAPKADNSKYDMLKKEVAALQQKADIIAVKRRSTTVIGDAQYKEYSAQIKVVNDEMNALSDALTDDNVQSSWHEVCS
jgi:hypothetical protein